MFTQCRRNSSLAQIKIALWILKFQAEWREQIREELQPKHSTHTGEHTRNFCRAALLYFQLQTHAKAERRAGADLELAGVNNINACVRSRYVYADMAPPISPKMPPSGGGGVFINAARITNTIIWRAPWQS
jgi:hypothetical protein